ncbi:MAG: hypothetical protein JWM56_877 [Candidatus Peribacteria bacterium]|nr:hypothetical protein [Candidatus Peribacteria bacterium]
MRTNSALKSLHPDMNANYEYETEDLRHLQPQQQAAFLKERLIDENPDVRNRVYLLRGTFEEAIYRMTNMESLASDCDGTLTGIGTEHLDPRALHYLLELYDKNLSVRAVTGRHKAQIDALHRSHPQGMGLKEWIFEQGAYRSNGIEEPEFFLGGPELEEKVAYIRTAMKSIFDEAAKKFNVEFNPTSGGGHKTILSYDAEIPGTGKRITDHKLHETIMEFLKPHATERVADETWPLNSSATGIFEWARNHGSMGKGPAILELARRGELQLHTSGFAGDSSNDMSAFELEDLLKIVVVNKHTPNAIINLSDVATIGEGNAAPVLNMMNRVRQHELFHDILSPSYRP